MDHHPLMRTPKPALGLLLSATVDRQAGGRIGQIAASHGIRIASYTDDAPPDDLAAIDAAFFSRDLYEGSELRSPGPAARRFFQIVDQAPRLRWLHVCSAGLDLPQYAPSLARGVRVTGSSGATARPIAQTALAAIVAQSRGFPHWLDAQSRHTWSPVTGSARPTDIDEQHVLLAGTGPIGLTLGRMLQATGFQVTLLRRRANPLPDFPLAIDYGQLDQTLPDCDWLVLALPLTPQTQGLIDARRLALLPRRARIANVARGELIDETALIRALAAGRLAGAYLDTFAQEPLPAASPLWALPNVWLTPHNSAASSGHEARVVAIFLRELANWLQAITPGEPS